ncbi:hypothetical protein BSR19_10710 (plasmid) [Streptococcus salivarius]|uniref:Uncharacterized protein n=1 Tax=Streptococcus salivarius TaxID=1304 RepID=A0AB37DE33_STRSL|nr:hypothetical protein BSR19_10710 [Streptococcus salivarius]
MWLSELPEHMISLER